MHVRSYYVHTKIGVRKGSAQLSFSLLAIPVEYW